MKSVLSIAFVLGCALAVIGQAPPNAATNAPAQPTAGLATDTTNAGPTPEQIEMIRRQLQQTITNRLMRAGTNRLALPLPLPGGTNLAAGTNVAVPTFPIPGGATAAGQPANVAGQVADNPALQRPAAPTLQAQVPGAGLAGANEPAEHILKFNNAPPDQIFEKYAELTGRTVLRPAGLPAAAVTIITYAPLTRDEAIQALDGALALNGITMLNQGPKFVKAIPAQQAPQEGAAISPLGHAQMPEAEQFLTHVVQLKILKPSEAAQVFASFSKTPNGIVPIDSSQILVIRDYASNIKRMLELIEKVDVPPESDYKLEVIPIKYGKVTDIFYTMNALISGSAGGGVSPSSSATQRRPGTLPTSGTFGTPTGSRLGVPTGSRLGQQYGVTPQQTATQQQPGATAGTSFQQRLNQIVSRAAGESQIQVLGDARIVPDERSNSLIVFANKQDFQMITNIVSKVDVLLAQVLIEGIVISVALDDSYDLGVSWLQRQKQFGQDFTGAGAIRNGPSFVENLTNFAGLLPSGFSYFGKLGNDFEVAVAAAASDSRVRIHQRPRLQTSHAVPGTFFTGSTVPYVTGFYDYGGFGTSVGTRSQVEQIQVGVSLNVTPFITPDGLVVLDIAQDISALDGFVQIDNNDVPRTTSRNAATTLSVKDGETIMLGGYIEDSRSNTKSGVPVLKDIPLLGALFRSKGKDNNRRELILLLHVTVLKNPADASAQAEAETAKLPGVSTAEKEFKKTEENTLKGKKPRYQFKDVDF